MKFNIRKTGSRETMGSQAMSYTVDLHRNYQTSADVWLPSLGKCMHTETFFHQNDKTASDDRHLYGAHAKVDSYSRTGGDTWPNAP